MSTSLFGAISNALIKSTQKNYEIYGKIENTSLLHFMFVKKAFRKNGVGKELLYNVYPDRKSPVFCTFWSHSMQVIDARRKWNAKFASNLLPAVIHTIHTKDNVQEVHRGAA